MYTACGGLEAMRAAKQSVKLASDTEVPPDHLLEVLDHGMTNGAILDFIVAAGNAQLKWSAAFCAPSGI